MLVIQAPGLAQLSDAASLTPAAAKFLRSRAGKCGQACVPGRGFNLLSAKDEQQMGDDLEAEIMESVEIIKDPKLTEYLSGVVAKLSVSEEARQRKFVLKVIKDDGVNAMSLPNGTIFVNTGLLLFVQNESELAGVLAHEMAHVTARHASRNATRRGIWGAATLAVTMFGGGAGPALEPATHVTSQVFGARFSRENELEADFYGLRYLQRAGYDPAEFVGLLRRISAQEPAQKGKLKAMFASHPPTADRLQTAKFVVDSFEGRDDLVIDTSSFMEAKANVIELTHPESQGACAGPVLVISAKADTPQAQ